MDPPVTRAATAGHTITTGDTPRVLANDRQNEPLNGKENDLQKSPRIQNCSAWMMKRLKPTAVQPRPDSRAVAAGASRRSGSSRNGPTISTVNNDVRAHLSFFDFCISVRSHQEESRHLCEFPIAEVF